MIFRYFCNKIEILFEIGNKKIVKNNLEALH
jgi:hypothetical protein